MKKTSIAKKAPIKRKKSRTKPVSYEADKPVEEIAPVIPDETEPIEKEPIETDLYNIEITIGAQFFSAKTSDLCNAIANFAVDNRPKLTSKVLIKITAPTGKAVEKWMRPNVARRIFNNQLASQYYIRNFLTAF